MSHWTFSGRPVVGAAALALALALAPAASAQENAADAGIAALATPDDPPVFDNPAAAVDAFKGQLAKNDLDGLAKLLGLDAAKLRAQDGIMDTFAEIRENAAGQVHLNETDDRVMLELGKQLWPFPFPLVKGDDGKWSFDTFAGLEEVVNRRVGENELEAISTMRAFVEAENAYADKDHDGDGVLEYAQKLLSSEGAHDGLYWPAG
ncbi:MAG: DUF2950 family protein, partial [Rhizobiaceae bacterium]|nr:DUF2950 family protein [Rhizobiaceae bacterium]